jgi:hypothetical protein
MHAWRLLPRGVRQLPRSKTPGSPIQLCSRRPVFRGDPLSSHRRDKMCPPRYVADDFDSGLPHLGGGGHRGYLPNIVLENALKRVRSRTERQDCSVDSAAITSGMERPTAHGSPRLDRVSAGFRKQFSEGNHHTAETLARGGSGALTGSGAGMSGSARWAKQAAGIFFL